MTTEKRPRGRLAPAQAGGFVMVLGGAIWLASYLIDDVALYAPLAVGFALLAAFALTFEYGFLVPGGIVTGVGTGILVATNLQEPAGGGALILSLAGGFVAIFAVSKLTRLPEHHFWPLIPGTILGVVGAAITVGQPGIMEYAGVVAAGIMVLAGLALVWRGWTGGHGHRAGPGPALPQGASTGRRRPPG